MALGVIGENRTEKSRKILLQYPPVSSPWHLPTGVSMLAGVLNAEGHEVVQRYGHIEGLEAVLLAAGGEEIADAMSIIRNRCAGILDFYNVRRSLQKISEDISTNDRFSVQRNNVLYVNGHQDGSIGGVIEAAKDRNNSLWYDFFKDVEVTKALEFKPDIYGISVSDERQLVQACILASMIKEALPQTKVVLGGNFWARVISAFQHPDFAHFAEICDAIVYR